MTSGPVQSIPPHVCGFAPRCLRPSDIDAGVSAFGPSQLLEPLPECSEAGLSIPSSAAIPISTPMRRIAHLLRARRERPRCRCATNET